MTDAMYNRIVHLVRKCPQHEHLDGKVFHSYTQSVLNQVRATQSRPVPLLPDEIAKDIR